MARANPGIPKCRGEWADHSTKAVPAGKLENCFSGLGGYFHRLSFSGVPPFFGFDGGFYG
jgi:hypothetical protein